MKIITTKEDFEKAKSRDLIEIECQACKNIFKRTKHDVQNYLKRDCGNLCSVYCRSELRKKGKTHNCSNCKKPVYRRNSEANKIRKKSNRFFCSQSCSATYNNTHKTHGHRRSKLENWLEIRLKELYPNVEINFNQKNTINAELDIYIPSLKLAFELNGIFHYEPIFGQEKLDRIINNDKRKFQACLEKGIEFCIIDTSKQTYFKDKTSQQFLDIITNIINTKLTMV